MKRKTVILLQFRQQKRAKIVLTLNGKLWYLLDKELDVGNRKYSRRTLNIITKDFLLFRVPAHLIKAVLPAHQRNWRAVLQRLQNQAVILLLWIQKIQ